METNYPERNSGHGNSLVLGNEFQDYCIDLFADSINFIIQQYTTKTYQYKCGESRQGVEIKLDNRHIDTSRLSIEIAEKSNGNNKEFVPGGIYSEPLSLFYIIGNYESVYLFSSKFLRQLHEVKGYEEAVHPREKPTIKKFYMPLLDAQKYCITHLTPIS